jgi:hypothetical protein
MEATLTILYEEGDRDRYRPYVQLRKYSCGRYDDYILVYGAGKKSEWVGSILSTVDPGIFVRKVPLARDDNTCIREAIATLDALKKEYGKES